MTLRFPAGPLSRAMLLIATLAGAALLVVACAPLALINSMVPPDTYSVTQDQSYGGHARDLRLP